MGIKLLVTGGTFDKEYNELKGELFFRETHVSEILSQGRSRVKVDIEQVMASFPRGYCAGHKAAAVYEAGN